MFAVVEKSLWPSHSWICFMGTPFARSNEAQLCRRSWKRIRRSPCLSKNFGKEQVRYSASTFRSVVRMKKLNTLPYQTELSKRSLRFCPLGFMKFSRIWWLEKVTSRCKTNFTVKDIFRCVKGFGLASGAFFERFLWKSKIFFQKNPRQKEQNTLNYFLWRFSFTYFARNWNMKLRVRD